MTNIVELLNAANHYEKRMPYEVSAMMREIVKERDQLRAELKHAAQHTSEALGGNPSTWDEVYQAISQLRADNSRLKDENETIKALSGEPAQDYSTTYTTAGAEEEPKDVQAWRRCYIKMRQCAEELEKVLADEAELIADCRVWERTHVQLQAENAKLEGQLKAIAEDGTEEHNAAVRLRQELARVREENTRLTQEINEALMLAEGPSTLKDLAACSFERGLRAEEAEKLLADCAKIIQNLRYLGHTDGREVVELEKRLRARKEGK